MEVGAGGKGFGLKQLCYLFNVTRTDTIQMLGQAAIRSIWYPMQSYQYPSKLRNASLWLNGIDKQPSVDADLPIFDSWINKSQYCS